MKIYLYFYTDSVGFPRMEGQSMDVSWPYIIKDILIKKYGAKVYICHRGLGGASVSDINNIFKRDSGYFVGHDNPISFVILNVGIVDAAPRPFTYPLRKLTNIPKIGKVFALLLRYVLKPHRKIFQQIYSYRLTPPKKFNRIFSWMVRRVIERGMIPISIDTPLTPLRIESVSPGLRDSIELYNKIKHESQIEHISCNWVDDSYLVDDGHHFNLKGNAELAGKVCQTIDKYLITELDD